MRQSLYSAIQYSKVRCCPSKPTRPMARESEREAVPPARCSFNKNNRVPEAYVTSPFCFCRQTRPSLFSAEVKVKLISTTNPKASFYDAFCPPKRGCRLIACVALFS
ncbi:unnamed protein product [Ascophyllum nodosum]